MLKQYSQEQLILSEGDKDSKLYKIVSGNAEVYVGYGTNHETIIGILSEGAYFGEIGAFTDNASIYTVVAYCDCLIMEIEKDELEEYAKLNYRDLLAIMSNMANTMTNLKANIEMLSEDISSLIEDRENTKRNQEIAEHIRTSDVTKQLIRYQIMMGYNNL